MIPVFTYGPGTENFGGIYENTAIFDKIVYSFNLKMKTSRTDLKPTGLKVLLMKKCFAIFAAAVILTACGGGGGPKSVVDSLPDNFTPPGNSTTPVVRDTVPDTSAAEN